MVALVADSVKDADLLIEGYDSKANDDIKAEGKKGQLIDYAITIKRNGDGNREEYWIFAGPSKLSLLSSFKIKFEKVLSADGNGLFVPTSGFRLFANGPCGCWCTSTI